MIFIYYFFLPKGIETPTPTPAFLILFHAFLKNPWTFISSVWVSISTLLFLEQKIILINMNSDNKRFINN
jgi:hypothetical protein